MKPTKSTEDYLETIYILSLKEKDIRMKDIARLASVKFPSATEAVNKLIKNGYVEHSPYSDVTLTKKGEKIGKEIWNKHQILYKFLKEVLGISKDKAFREACLIEHFISDETREKLKKFIEKTLS